MRLTVLMVALLAYSFPAASSAASYQRRDGTIVDPILHSTLSFSTGIHGYDGPNLEPFASLRGASLSGADLSDAALTGADLTFATMAHVDLSGADLSGASLAGASMQGSSLAGADLSNALLVSVQSRDILGNPAALPSDWRLVEGYLVGPGANLAGAELGGADLSGASLELAFLSLSDLSMTDLTAADLTSAVLSGALLDGALYDEFTLFPSGFDIFEGYSGLPAGTTPWDLFMVPTPEPSAAVMLAAGALGAFALASLRS